MATSNRSTQFTKIHKVLKKHYTPVAPGPERPVLEHLLFACCLEDARYDQAERVYRDLGEFLINPADSVSKGGLRFIRASNMRSSSSL